MANDICEGDNVAIICESQEGEDFGILLIDKCAHILDEDVVDGWEKKIKKIKLLGIML